MHYTIWEQLLFFFLYGFLGWACSVVFHAFRTGRFVNPGVLYGPISLTSGLVMTIAIVLIADYAVRYLTQFFLTFVVIFIISSMGGVLAERTLGRKLWDYSGGRYFALGGWRGLVRTLILTLGVLLTVHLLHPFFYLPISMLPELAVQIIDAVLLFALLCDLFTLSWAVRAIKTAYTTAYAKLEADSNYPDEKLEEYGVGSLRKAAKDGNATEGCFLAGQIAGMVNKEQPAAEIIEEIMTKAEQMMEGVKWDV